MAYETIIVDVENHVALITLNRPDALNALNAQLLGELADAMTACQANDKVRCIVLTGSEKAFAAGADIAMLQELTPETKYYFCLHANETLVRLEQTPKLVIAAINGHECSFQTARQTPAISCRQDSQRWSIKAVSMSCRRCRLMTVWPQPGQIVSPATGSLTLPR